METIEEDGSAALERLKRLKRLERLERLERLTLLETYEEAYNRALSLQESEVCGDGKAQSRLMSRMWEAWDGHSRFQVIPSSPASISPGLNQSVGDMRTVEENVDATQEKWKLYETQAKESRALMLQASKAWDAMKNSEAASDIEWQGRWEIPKGRTKKEKLESPKTFKILEESSSPLDHGDIDDDFRSVSSYVSKSTFHTAVSRLDGKSSYKLDARLHRSVLNDCKRRRIADYQVEIAIMPRHWR